MNPEIKELYKSFVSKTDKTSVLVDSLSLVAWSADAGCYKKIPRMIVKPRNEDDVRFILEELHERKIPLTFRAAGTSLSGQAITDSVLMQAAGDRWSRTEVLDQGKYVKTQPGITGLRLNQVLKPYGVKFGPDPASLNSAMVGGIIANNASGMSCGTHANSYSTIRSAKIIFNDGTLLDTSNEESRRQFPKKKPGIIAGIEELRDKIKADPELVSLIKEKYSIKNTTGYGMNSFVDFDDPFDIILHLMIGSEGTLGFVSEAVFETVPLKNFRASSLVYFQNPEAASKAVPLLKEAGVPAIELMDRKALASVEGQKGIPEYIREFHSDVTALLIDLEAGSENELDEMAARTEQILSNFKLERNFELTRDPKKILEVWKVRKGVFPSVGGMRKPGTIVIIEDVAVKTERLTEAAEDLRNLLDANGYEDAVIYGHALDGNLHFIFSQNFEDQAELKQYENLIKQVTELIVEKYNGSLKAEHGTGLNMAPFVNYEWGEKLYGYMKEVKKIFDPENILNPGVIINDDEKIHLKNFKQLPEVDESVDKCIECGFCEISCLSTGLTLSARQRIVVQRELKLLSENNGDTGKIKEINSAFKYMGDKTCAGDGLCSVTCPLDIDTGVLIKKLREKKNATGKFNQALARTIANNFKLTLGLMRNGLGMISFFHKTLGTKAFNYLAKGVGNISFKKIPQWNPSMPGPAVLNKKDIHILHGTSGKVVYFPSCINQAMGPSVNQKKMDSLGNTTVRVLNRAGYEVIFPSNMNNLCCGTPWESKGFLDIADLKSHELEEELMKVSNEGEYPVLCDTSPCIYRMKKKMNKALHLYEPVEFIHDFLLDNLDIKKAEGKLAFHITCSSVKMDLEDKFKIVAASCVEEPVFPEQVGCCGFAGDKGFSVPELNDWALRNLKEEVSECNSGISNSRTCEIGLSKSSGIDYKSVLYLIDECSKDNAGKSFSESLDKPHS